jgi:hypothetical protein
MTPHRILFLTVVIGLSAVVLFSLGYMRKKIDEQTEPPVNLEASLDAEIAAEPLKHITGEILAVSGNTFQLKILSVKDTELDASLRERKVRVEPQTTITAIEKRDGSDVKAEMEAFQEAMVSFEKIRNVESDAVPPKMPVLFDKKTITVGDLEEGQQVSIVADADIRLEKNFTARSIEIIPPAK